MATKFYKCDSCGNVITKLVDSGVPVVCCGKGMTLLQPTPVTDQNRHLLPHVTLLDGGHIRLTLHENVKCSVGDNEKMFLYLEFEHGGIVINDLSKPEINLSFGPCRPLALYKYCTHCGLLRLSL